MSDLRLVIAQADGDDGVTRALEASVEQQQRDHAELMWVAERLFQRYHHPYGQRGEKLIAQTPRVRAEYLDYALRARQEWERAHTLSSEVLVGHATAYRVHVRELREGDR